MYNGCEKAGVSIWLNEKEKKLGSGQLCIYA